MDHFALLIKLRGDAGVGSLGNRMMGSSGWAGGGGALPGMGSANNSPHAHAMGELNRLAHDLMGTNQRRAFGAQCCSSNFLHLSLLMYFDNSSRVCALPLIHMRSTFQFL